ncbi:hypothetical protein J2857_002871 [Neorhizobium galegae]|uniref:DUF4365 domain-containing protein n=1 Tax=Neorhizobium galegae TaxID=399 RepID=UPI001AEB5267|nr:DUF4365 domain-containing protein [Neorhizobium galegae]MBP2560102.1 hypothetical protein [Neorhizobium galegae]
MAKTITQNQINGEIGETATRLCFLKMGFQFDGRSRLEAGIDGIAEVMLEGRPTAGMIAVQVKTTESGTYSGEDDQGFSYLLRAEDLEYWRPSNLPVIIVLHRISDGSLYWKEVPTGDAFQDRRLKFSKAEDRLGPSAVDRLASLTVPKTGFGYYIPPLGGGEEALVNILPVKLPREMYVATTKYDRKQASAIILGDDEPARFDWATKGGGFWSFHDPRTSVCRKFVDLDQVEAIEVEHLAFHEDENERNNFAFLLRQTLSHQVRGNLSWSKEKRLHYFTARAKNTGRVFKYRASKKNTEAEVVNVVMDKDKPERVSFVRHHAFIPRFESLFDEWYLVIEPTYFFTYDGMNPHTAPDALLSGKKRMDNSSAIRGQVIMWHRFLQSIEPKATDLFAAPSVEPWLTFGEPPMVQLPTRVPEDAWRTKAKSAEEEGAQGVFEI